MKSYICDGMRPVKEESMAKAAKIFANRQARKEYGRRGYARTIRLDHWTQDGAFATFQAFIGKDIGGGSTAGHDVWIDVKVV